MVPDPYPNNYIHTNVLLNLYHNNHIRTSIVLDYLISTPQHSEIKYNAVNMSQGMLEAIIDVKSKNQEQNQEILSDTKTI